MEWEQAEMEFFSTLFDSQWRERADPQVTARYNQHYESMPQQVMASRAEIAYLHSELNRVSQDLAQTLLLNRALLTVLLSTGQVNPEQLQEVLKATLADQEAKAALDSQPSKFCEDCGRPLPASGQKCPYCAEIDVPLVDLGEEEANQARPAKKKSQSAGGKKRSKKQSEVDI